MTRRWQEVEKKERQENYDRLKSVLDQEQDGTLGKDGYDAYGYTIGVEYDVANTPKSMSDPYYHPGGRSIGYRVALIVIVAIILAIVLSAFIHLVQMNVFDFCYC